MIKIINIFYSIRFWIFRSFFNRDLDLSFVRTYDELAPIDNITDFFRPGLGEMDKCFEDGLETIDETCVDIGESIRLFINRVSYAENPRPYNVGAVMAINRYTYGRFDFIVRAKLSEGKHVVVGLADVREIYGYLRLSEYDLGDKGKILSIIWTKNRMVFKLNNLTVGVLKSKGTETVLRPFVSLAVVDEGRGIDDSISTGVSFVRFGYSSFINKHRLYNLKLRHIIQKSK